MYIIFYITAAIILLYLVYPLFLLTLPGIRLEKEENPGYDPPVSVILLSYNGLEFLEGKIQFLLKELTAFSHYELILIDDHSNDGSGEFLENYKGREGVRVYVHPEHKGIPFSMNFGIEKAQHEVVIFCDQRQLMAEGILKKLVQPLKSGKVGAVSACISSRDKENQESAIRKYENFIKSRESRCGSLIGVYGPCYAVRKEDYIPIPEEVVLDDLFLSLRIMGARTVLLEPECLVIDENMSKLYTVGRARRYLAGFWQILKDREIRQKLSLRQHAMLLWHKYLRLLIPLFIALSYVNLIILSFSSQAHLILLVSVTLAGAAILLSKFPATFNGLKCLLKVNLCYLAGLADMLANKVTKQGKPSAKSEFGIRQVNEPERML